MSFRTSDITDLRELLQNLLRRLDDLERKRDLPPNYRIVEIDGNLFIENTVTGELTPLGDGCLECPPCDRPRIWRTPTTRVGSVSWVGESGEEAVLAPTTVEYLTGIEGGVMAGTHIFDSFGVSRPGYVDLDNEGVLVVTMRASMWWSASNYYPDTTQFMQWYFYGDAFDPSPGLIGGHAWWDSNYPTNTLAVPEIDELVFYDGWADVDINNDLNDVDSEAGWLPFKPGDVGLGGWATGWMRTTLDQNTNVCTIELSLDDNGIPAGWSTVASDTFLEPFSGGPFNSYVEFNKDWNGGEPSRQAGYIVHDWIVEVDGVFQYGWTAEDIAAHDLPIGSTTWPAQDQYISGTTILDVPTGRMTLAAHPGVFLPHSGGETSGGGVGWGPLWESGPVLDNPCILFSRFEDPGHIVRIVGVQPTDFYGMDRYDQPITSATNLAGVYPGGWCWGVCDLGDPLVGPNFWSIGGTVQDLPNGT